MSTESQRPVEEELAPEEQADWEAYREIKANRDLIERLADADLPVSHRYQRLLEFADEFEEEHDV